MGRNKRAVSVVWEVASAIEGACVHTGDPALWEPEARAVLRRLKRLGLLKDPGHVKALEEIAAVGDPKGVCTWCGATGRRKCFSSCPSEIARKALKTKKTRSKTKGGR